MVAGFSLAKKALGQSKKAKRQARKAKRLAKKNAELIAVLEGSVGTNIPEARMIAAATDPNVDIWTQEVYTDASQ